MRAPITFIMLQIDQCERVCCVYCKHYSKYCITFQFIFYQFCKLNNVNGVAAPHAIIVWSVECENVEVWNECKSVDMVSRIDRWFEYFSIITCVCCRVAKIFKSFAYGLHN